MLRHLPAAPALVADIGGGPGRYGRRRRRIGGEMRERQLRDELSDAGLSVADLVSVQGPAFLLGDLAERMADPAARAVVLDVARAVERVPELIGIGPHLLATGIRRPPRAGTASGLSGSRGW